SAADDSRCSALPYLGASRRRALGWDGVLGSRPRARSDIRLPRLGCHGADAQIRVVWIECASELPPALRGWSVAGCDGHRAAADDVRLAGRASAAAQLGADFPVGRGLTPGAGPSTEVGPAASTRRLRTS